MRLLVFTESLKPKPWISEQTAIQYFSEAPEDYSIIGVLDTNSGEITSALPLFEFMASHPDQWMSNILDGFKHCDIDPALHARILNIAEDDWIEWQHGRLKTVSMNTAVRARLLMDIFNLINSFVGGWENISWWLNNVKQLRRFDNRCPLQIICDGNQRELAKLQRFLACEVLSSPYV